MTYKTTKPIKLDSNVCRNYKIESTPLMAAYVAENQPGPYREITRENIYFNESVDLSGKTLYDFVELNKKYLEELNCEYIHELQDYLDEHSIYYSIREI